MTYVLRTDALGESCWFAGMTDGKFDLALVITPVIFDAYYFEDHSEAENMSDQLGGAFFVAEIIGRGTIAPDVH